MQQHWQTGVANVERADARHVFVRCPHCSQTHVHGRAVLGSRNVVAGCHVGFTGCLEYVVPDLGVAPPPRKPKVAS